MRNRFSKTCFIQSFRKKGYDADPQALAATLHENTDDGDACSGTWRFPTQKERKAFEDRARPIIEKKVVFDENFIPSEVQSFALKTIVKGINIAESLFDRKLVPCKFQWDQRMNPAVNVLYAYCVHRAPESKAGTLLRRLSSIFYTSEKPEMPMGNCWQHLQYPRYILLMTTSRTGRKCKRYENVCLEQKAI